MGVKGGLPQWANSRLVRCMKLITPFQDIPKAIVTIDKFLCIA